MKELRHNMRIVGVLVIVAFVTLAGWFALTVFEQGSIWASNSYNTRLGASNAYRGDILDRNGVPLATTSGGKRAYLADASARRAMAAVVGDTRGMSGTGVESAYSAQLLNLSDSLLERLSALFNGQTRKGSTVRLTVDAELSNYISSIFPEGYRGAVNVMNYKTGEVLAMISEPNYDPYDAGSENVEDTAYLNRCLQGLYTPGSVFKLVTMTAALEHDPAVLNQTFLCNGVWEYEGGRVVCAGQHAHGEIDLETALVKSCNVTFGKLAYQLGLSRLRETAEALGFNENFKLGDFSLYNSQFPTEIENPSDLVWAGVGQSTILTTPMHMTMITSAIANGGQMVKPVLIGNITSSTGVTERSASQPVYRQVMSAETAATISQAMYKTVQSGTATRGQVQNYAICGKTGSAETSDDKTVETNSWYTGFVYDSAHPYAISVVVEQGGAGSRLATELSAKVLSYMLNR